MLITNIKQADLQQFGNFYYSLDKLEKKIEKNDELLLLKGYLYPDVKKSIEDFYEFFARKGMHKDIKAFKGRYCGCFINKKNSSLIIFNDQLGLYDIFYYFENGSIILSDKFSKILRIKEFGREDLDLVAMAEFLLCTHVLRERTFIKSVKLLPIATMKSFDLVTDAIESLTYWQYSFITNSYFNKKDALNGVDHLFKQSMSRIAALNPDKSFAIGLSGGYDSRISAKYASDLGIDLHPFVYNYMESDSKHISQKIACAMGLEVKPVEIKNDYMALKDNHINYDPMHNVMYTTYCTVIDNLPRADEMLSGFLGGELFGNHIRPWDTNPDINVVDKIKKRLFLYREQPIVSSSVEKEITNDIRYYEKMDDEDWKCCEIFEYENRQRRFVKNSPGFSFYGKYEQYYSMFSDIDLVEYVTTFPLDQLQNKSFYFDFHRQFLPGISKIRAEREAFSLHDSERMKAFKKNALLFKFKLARRFNVTLPIYNTINFLGHFDWASLFKFSGFEKEYKNIDIQDIYSDSIKKLPDDFRTIKFHYLTLQYFLDRYIDQGRDKKIDLYAIQA